MKSYHKWNSKLTGTMSRMGIQRNVDSNREGSIMGAHN